jgi:hypothetical protein
LNATYGKRQGFNAGVAYEYAVNDFFSVSPGLAIETRGEDMEWTIDAPFRADTFTNINYELMYIQIPILAQLNIPVGPVLCNVFLGPDIGFKISAKATTAIHNIIGVPATTKDMEDISAYDVGLTMGLGYEVTVVDPVGIYLRQCFFLGFVDVNYQEEEDLPVDDPSAIDKWKHRNIKIELGFKINL